MENEPVLLFREGPRSLTVKLPLPDRGEDRRTAILIAIEIAEEFILEAEDELKASEESAATEG